MTRGLPMSVEERYLALVDAFAGDEAVGRYGSGKGTAALKANGKMSRHAVEWAARCEAAGGEGR